MNSDTRISLVEALQLDLINTQLQNIALSEQNLQLQFGGLQRDKKEAQDRRVKLIADIEGAHPELVFSQAVNTFVPRPVEAKPEPVPEQEAAEEVAMVPPPKKLRRVNKEPQEV